MIETDFIPYAACTSLGSGAVLVFAPHPDDEVFGCAGALMQHVAAGDPVHVIVVTDGAWMEGSDYAETRRQESRAAGAVLGCGEPAFWNLPDRSLQYGEWLIDRIHAGIEEHRAERVYAPSSREMHPDHRALALAAAEAVRRCIRPISLVMYEVGVPLQPNRLLDITALLGRKQAAMDCFVSQLERQTYDRHVTALNRFRTYTLPVSIEAAEAYRIFTRDELRADPVGVLRQDTFADPGWSADASLSLPLVSVIIRSNDRPNLRATLDSVALQTYPHIEMLVIDARGSGHSGLADWYGRFPLRLIRSTRPLSRGQAANLGIDQSQGQYLAILDDDKVLHPDHIATLTDALRESERAWCAYAQGSEADPLREKVRFPKEKLYTRNLVPLHAALFDRILIAQGCRFDEQLAELQDWDFLLQVAQRTPWVMADLFPGLAGTKQASDIEIFPNREALSRVYEKWRHYWPGTQWADIVRGLESEIDAAEQRVAVLQSRLDEQVEPASALRKQLAERDTELALLRNQLADRSADLEHNRLLLFDAEARVQRLEAENQALTVWASGLGKAMDDKPSSSV